MIVEEQTGRPRWVKPVTAALMVALGIVAAVVDGRPDASALRYEGPWELRLAAVAIVVGLSLAVVTGRRVPTLVFVMGVAVPAAWLNVARDGAVSFIFVAIAMGWVAYTDHLRVSQVALGIGLAATAISYLLNTDPEGWLGYTAGMIVIWFAMRSIVRQQELVSQLRATQATLARETRAAERRRIAREVHDVAAHTLAVTMLQLTGVRLMLQRSGGDRQAIEALAEAERLGRQGLDDVRRTVGLLGDSERSAGPPDAMAPLPGGADIPALVAEYRAAGLNVELSTHGSFADLPAAVGLALYRIVQEALANVVRHAPGATARVELDVGGGSVRLRVLSSRGRDAPTSRAADGTGLGLVGMRERAALLGGTLEAGAERDGWRVESTIPLPTNRAEASRAAAEATVPTT